MVTILPQKQMSAFGQAASGFGAGLLNRLSEDIPKRMEEKRLSQGLQALAQEGPNLSNTEYIARLESIPGVSAEGKRQLSEAKQKESLINAYKPKSTYENRFTTQGKGTYKDSEKAEKQEASESLQNIEDRRLRKDITFGNFDKNSPNKSGSIRSDNVISGEVGVPSLGPGNPTAPEARMIPRHTPEQRNENIGRFMDMGHNFETAARLADDQEQREINQAETVRAQNEYLNLEQIKAKEKFKDQLSLKLHKSGEDTLKDISGDMQNNLMRGMERDLANNPRLSVDDAVNDWTNRGLQLAKTKTQFQTLADGIGFSDYFSNATENKLKEYSTIYERAGNSEEYFKALQSEVGLSPQAAASIAYPRSKGASSIIKSYKANPVPVLAERDKQARNVVSNLGDKINENDSLLAIAKDLRDKDPFFDQKAFFEQLSNDKDFLPLTGRQRLEIAEGVSGTFPNWNDFLISRTKG